MRVISPSKLTERFIPDVGEVFFDFENNAKVQCVEPDGITLLACNECFYKDGDCLRIDCSRDVAKVRPAVVFIKKG